MNTPNYARHAFNAELKQLEHAVLEMGSIAETMVRHAVDSLTTLDHDLALATLRRDDEIDRRDLEIETRCLRLLALQQPTGSDLREIGTVMKIITDIERVGDLAGDIAKTAMKIEKEMGSTSGIDIPSIGTLAANMFREALEAFVRRDLDLVNAVIVKDDIVDQRYRDLRAEIFDNMRRETGEAVADGWLFMAIHHLERIADHAVNIVERVHFMVTGEFRQHIGVPKPGSP